MKSAYLTFDERKSIESLLKDGLNGSKISQILGRDRSSINMDIRRNGGPENYTAAKAQEASELRKLNRGWVGADLNKNGFLEKVKDLHQKGYSVVEIYKTLSGPHSKLMKALEILGHNNINNAPINQELELRIYAIEEQLKILFEIMESK